MRSAAAQACPHGHMLMGEQQGVTNARLGLRLSLRCEVRRCTALEQLDREPKTPNLAFVRNTNSKPLDSFVTARLGRPAYDSGQPVTAIHAQEETSLTHLTPSCPISNMAGPRARNRCPARQHTPVLPNSPALAEHRDRQMTKHLHSVSQVRVRLIQPHAP